MAGCVPTLYWFSRFDDRIGVLGVVGTLRHEEELNGQDTLEFMAREVPTKGDRLLWRDGIVWREHVVVRTTEPLGGICSVYAESSLCEMLDDFIEEEHLVNRTVTQALQRVLAPTRWTIAHCADLGTSGCVLYHVNALWALRRVATIWGGEVCAVIGVSGDRVSSRSVRLDACLGAWRGLRFTYGKNVHACTRTVLEEDVHTALYGFGMGLPLVDEDGRFRGGYRRKLTFGSVNGGVNWVGDEAARLVWGRWDAARQQKVHSFGQVSFPQIEDPNQLLSLTRRALEDAVQPKVSYEVDVAAIDGGEADLGDEVAVIDTSRTPEWRLKARVVRRVREFGEKALCRITIGTAQRMDWEVTGDLVADVSALQDDVAGIDGQISVATSTAYVQETVTEAIADLDDLSDMDF